jgi:hypothetical protein
MKEIPLTKGYVALVDDEDFEWLSKFKWQANIKHSGDVYAHRDTLAHEIRDNPALPNKTKMHRLIMGFPEGKHVDHINGNTLDNRRQNLRVCSKGENMRNSKLQRRSKTGYKGVSVASKTTFSAHIRIEKRLIHIGNFKSPIEAAIAYNEHAIKHFGEFARINNI